MDTIRAYREILKENIEYDHLRKNLGYDYELLDEILEILVDTVCSTRKMIRIGGEDFPKEIVKSRLLKLDSSHIEYVISSLRENTTKVRNIRAYLLTSLYNAPTTINSYYTALVNHDMYGSGYHVCFSCQRKGQKRILHGGHAAKPEKRCTGRGVSVGKLIICLI